MSPVPLSAFRYNEDGELVGPERPPQVVAEWGETPSVVLLYDNGHRHEVVGRNLDVLCGRLAVEAVLLEVVRDHDVPEFRVWAARRLADLREEWVRSDVWYD